MNESNRLLLSGDEAIALAARHAGVALGAGYPGTPSTEILEHFSELGGHAQWSPNEKVALEVTIGAAFGGALADPGPVPGHDPRLLQLYRGATARDPRGAQSCEL